MTTDTRIPAKPHYLGLLNRISVAESNAGVYLKAWADATPDPEVRKTAEFVGGRETTHGTVFCQRIQRLGFTLQPVDDPTLAEKIRVYGDRNLSDMEKVRYNRRSRRGGEGPDYGLDDSFTALEDVIKDVTVDQLTRDMLRWYVSEERDSIRLLKMCFSAIERQAAHTNGAVSGPSADARAIMDCMTQNFASLQQSVKELCEAVGKLNR